MRIARVFPTKTNMCPMDRDAYFEAPDLYTPWYDEVHISTTFTWDIDKAQILAKDWSHKTPMVKIGGPAFGDCGDEFFSGVYLRNGVIITSRGCPNDCWFCFVRKREGELRELPIVGGNIIQDNNLLACSKRHLDQVWAMLKKQKHIDFPGGFEAKLVTDEIVEQLRGLHIYQMWLAYDQPYQEKDVVIATNRLSKYFKRNKIRCYVLIGYPTDTIEKAEIRLRRAWEIGTLPFAMLYYDEKNTPQSKEWKKFQRLWCRPAIIKSRVYEKKNLCP